MGLCLEPDEASKTQLQEIEQHLVRALTALSLSEPKVFGKFLTETDVQDRFQSCLKTSPRGGSGGESACGGPIRRSWWSPATSPAGSAGSGASCAMADVQPVRPTARSNRSAAEGLLESEVRALGVAQEDPPLERQALARGVGDGVAQAGKESPPSKTLTRPPAPMSFRPGQTRMVCGMLVVVGPDDQADVRLALPRKSFSGRLECLGQGLLCQPSVRSWSSWQCLCSRCTGVPAKLSMIAGNWRKSPSSKKVDFAVHGDAGDIVPQPGVELCDFLCHQPVDVAVPVPYTS